jgi:hypothetical protein
LLAYCRSRFERVTWASFNWDCIFEASFWYSSGGPYERSNPRLAIPLAHYPFAPGDERHTLLKLHGGINWWRVGDDLTYIGYGNDGALDAQWNDYAAGKKHKAEPLILEPSYKVRRNHLDHLSLRDTFLRRWPAGAIIIVGYSLPEATRSRAQRS